MRLLVVYASDLSDPSITAPGGITSCVLGDVAALPASWEIECWGAAHAGAEDMTTRTLHGRTVTFRSLVETRSAAERRVPLSPLYTVALGLSSLRWLRRQRFDAVIAHRTDYLPSLALVPAALRPPIVSVIHGSSEWASDHFRGLSLRTYLASERFAVHHSAATALVAGSSLSYYRSRYPRVADRLHWVPNGVALERFAGLPSRAAARARFGLPQDHRILAYHGRYDREKGIGRMLAALQALHASGEQDWHLVTAGVGPDRELLAAAAATWAAGRISDLGYLASVDVPSFLATADLSLLLSDFEGLSLGLLESLAAGVPVIATPVGDTPTVLATVDPALVGPGEADAVAERIRYAWDRRTRLAAAARQTSERFSRVRRGLRLARLLELAAAGRSPEYADADL